MMRPQRSPLKQASIYIGAVVALIAAVLLLRIGGLPDRADYSGGISSEEGKVAPEIGALAPPFNQPTMDGGTLSLAELSDQSVVVNFWATWCTPCIVEMPALQAFHDDTGIRVVGINFGESRVTVADWIAANDITFDILLDPQQRVADDYQTRGLPSTYVIAPDGIITQIFYGPVTISSLQAALAAHESYGAANEQEG